jgi:hypothetical protein
MKKLSPVLALSLATCAACGGGAAGPTPTTPAGKVIAWSGTALRTTRTQLGLLDSTTTWEITNLTWVEDDGEVAPLGGGTLYKIGSGRVKETIRQVTGPCLATGETEFTLRPGDGHLVVSAGSYSGSITRLVPGAITVTADCGYGAAAADLTDSLELPIDSADDTARSSSRLRGTKTVTVAASTLTSTWDLTATAWER